jgi:hypothetical protein
MPAADGPRTYFSLPPGGQDVLLVGAANEAGNLVGTINLNGHEGAVVWSKATGGVIRVLEFPSQFQFAEAWGISKLGRVSGVAYFNSTPTTPGAYGPALWRPNETSPPVNLGWVLPTGCTSYPCPGSNRGSFDQATGVNDRDEVIGHPDPSGFMKAFRWNAATGRHVLLPLGGNLPATVANAINESGAIVGWATKSTGQRAAAYWASTSTSALTGAPTELIPPPTRFGTLQQSVARDINDNGDIAVYACTTGSSTEGSGCYSYLVVDGNWTRLPGSLTKIVASVSDRTADNRIEVAALSSGNAFDVLPYWTSGGTITTWTVQLGSDNHPPMASVGAPYNGTEGSPIALSLSGSDPDPGDQLTYAWDLGDGTTGSGTTPPTSHVYDDNPSSPATTYLISLAVTDSKGASDTKTGTVTVNNVAPTIGGLSVPSAVDEGSTIAFAAASVVDPSHADSQAGFTYDFACGTAAYDNTFSAQNSGQCPALDGPGTVTVRTRAKDKDGGVSAEKIATVTVGNVAPVLGTFTGLPTGPVPVVATSGTYTLTFGAAFTDPGTEDTHSGHAEWDTGQGFALADDIAKGARTVSATKALPAGVYTVSLKVADDDGGVDLKTASEYVVVYDPSAGFVTGGGWITSPNGACDATFCTAFTGEGKANFGFVSKYQKGATTPSGTTEFVFDAGGLSFKSTSYDWLVVSGPMAQYKGYGSVNGSSADYGFLLTAIDGALDRSNPTDRFRIKIWNRQTGFVIYDNRRGEAENSDASQTIGGGSITIHTR